MEITTYNIHLLTAELTDHDLVFDSPEQVVQFMVDLYFQGYEKIIVYQSQLHPDFFQLRTGMLGEVLQKFSNFRMQLAIIGDFSTLQSQSLNDFIKESNRGSLVHFVSSLENAM